MTVTSSPASTAAAATQAAARIGAALGVARSARLDLSIGHISTLRGLA